MSTIKSGGKSAGKSGGKSTGKAVGVAGKSGGARDMRVKVKKAGKLKHSSQLWLERQLNDPYVKRAREMGYRSRAAFKLEEMDDRFKFLKSGQKLIDLGCAPGGWCQIAAARVGLEKGKGRIVGIDLLPVDPIPGVDLIEMDFMADEAPALLTQRLGGRADGVMSDMAANTTGHKKTDHLKIIALAEAALEFAYTILAPGGFYLAKLFQGGESAELLAQLKRDFTTVRNVKPSASRADSSELYVLATGYRRKADEQAGDERADISEA
ncbi:MAG TPA: RlmE family RNA methyltransferase [Bosea sp. (in: a-proteobacteria)]